MLENSHDFLNSNILNNCCASTVCHCQLLVFTLNFQETEFLQAVRKNYVRQSFLHTQKPFTHGSSGGERPIRNCAISHNNIIS